MSRKGSSKQFVPKDRVHSLQGHVSFFLKVREMSGNSVMYQGKMKFCKKMSGKCQEIYISAL